MNYFAPNIRFLRRLRGLSQDEVANLTAITRGTWHNYENGNTQPEIDTILRIAKEFKVNSGELLEIDMSKKIDETPDDNNILQEPETPYHKSVKEEVSLLILRQLNTLVGDIVLIKQKLGL